MHIFVQQLSQTYFRTCSTLLRRCCGIVGFHGGAGGLQWSCENSSICNTSHLFHGIAIIFRTTTTTAPRLCYQHVSGVSDSSACGAHGSGASGSDSCNGGGGDIHDGGGDSGHDACDSGHGACGGDRAVPPVE